MTASPALAPQVKVICRFFLKKRMLRKGMPAGIKLDADSARAIVPPATVTLEEGLQSLRHAVTDTIEAAAALLDAAWPAGAGSWGKA